MSTPTQNITVLAGRILLGLLFLVSGFGKIAGFDGTVGYISAQHLPLPALAAVLTIVVEVGGGIALVTGLWTRQAALALAGFTLLTAFIFHAFWSAPDAATTMQQIQFLKNLSIAGGLFVLAAFGPGRISLAARRAAA
ncbi:MAG TPA: DoxX family protein [Caldimonas sp.]|jgi:putative oxidoreductase|nr:DoxX family protein [Caldimonas sp.]